MRVVSDIANLSPLPAGSHVCWLVDDAASYIPAARWLLAEGVRLAQKPVLLGPAGIVPLADPAAAVVVGPRAAFPGGEALDPVALTEVFRRHAALAAAEGYDGLRVVADMDRLRPERPATGTIVAFEVLLDRLVAESDATVVCAYDPSSFDTAAILGALSAHGLQAGHGPEPQFRLVSDSATTWRLAGEVDQSVSSTFSAALGAAAALGDCTIHVGDLRFVDVAGMRAIACAARAADGEVRLHGASATLRRHWKLGGFDQAAPMVSLAA